MSSELALDEIPLNNNWETMNNGQLIMTEELIENTFLPELSDINFFNQVDSGVSCEACPKRNFEGRHYKCLVCFNYDLCPKCYDQRRTTSSHKTDHPVQCILTRADLELYYGGEVINVDQCQSFTCPYCSRMGFTITKLLNHICMEHPINSLKIVCPVCAATIGGNPNMITDDLAGHLAIDHRNAGGTGSGDPSGVPASTSPTATRHGMRRTARVSRGVSGNRGRRSSMHFNSFSGLSSLSPTARVRRSTGSGIADSPFPNAPINATHMQQLQMQILLERDQVQKHLDRLPHRQTNTSSFGSTSTIVSKQHANTKSHQHQYNNQFLLASNFKEPLSGYEQEKLERLRANRSLFVQELLLSTITSSSDKSVPRQIST